MSLAMLPAGMRVDNLNYDLAELPASTGVICTEEAPLHHLLDNLTNFAKQWYALKTPPPDCWVLFEEGGIVIGVDTKLEYLYVSDEGDLYGIYQVPIGDQILWSYIDEEVMVKKDMF